MSPRPVLPGNTPHDAPDNTDRDDTSIYEEEGREHRRQYLGVQVVHVVTELSGDEHELVVEQHEARLRHPQAIAGERGHWHHGLQPRRVLMKIIKLYTP